MVEEAKKVDLSNGAPVPTLKVQKKERVVGILPDDLRRLYAIYAASENEFKATHDRIRIEVNALGGEAKVSAKKAKEIIQRHTLCHAKSDLVFNIFWGCVRLAFSNIAREENIGVRKGWKVVVGDPSLTQTIIGIALPFCL